MIDAWMKARVPPRDVFTILQLDDELLDQMPQVYQWLRYINAYRTTGSFSEEQTLGMLVGSMNEAQLALMFQSVKEVPDLKTQATNLQNLIFQKMIKDKEPPHEFAYYLTSPFGHPEDVFHMLAVERVYLRVWKSYSLPAMLKKQLNCCARDGFLSTTILCVNKVSFLTAVSRRPHNRPPCITSVPVS